MKKKNNSWVLGYAKYFYNIWKQYFTQNADYMQKVLSCRKENKTNFKYFSPYKSLCQCSERERERQEEKKWL